MPPRPPGERLAPLLVLLVLVPLWPLLLLQQVPVVHDVNISDLLHAHFPYRAFLGEHLRALDLPLWLPHVWSGTSLIGQIEAGALYLPHWPIFALLPAWAALDVALLVDRLVAGFGAWALARRHGAGPLPAVLAAVAFAGSGQLVAHTRHLNMHAGMALLPWMLLALEQVLATRARRGGAALAALVALSVLAGHPQVTWISGLALGARLLSALPARPLADGARVTVALTAAVGLGAGLAAAQLLPAAAATAASVGDVEMTFDYANALPFGPVDLWSFVAPGVVGSMETRDYIGRGIAWGNYAYLGLLPLLLAPLGLLPGSRASGRVRAFHATMVVLGVLLALGTTTPLWRVAWELLPGAKLFRFPVRFLLPATLSLAVLGAVGLQRLLDLLAARLPPAPARRLAVALPALLALVATVDLLLPTTPRLPTDDVAAWDRESPVAALIATGSAPGRVYMVDEWSQWERAFQRSSGWRDRAPYRAAWELPLGSAVVLQGLWSTTGYTRMVHHRTAALWQPYPRPSSYPWYVGPEWFKRGTLTPQQRTLLARASARYVVATSPVVSPGLRPLGRTEATGAVVYEYAAALPRAYVAGAWEEVEDLRGATAFMLRDAVDHHDLPAVEGLAGRPGTPSIVPAAVTDHGPDALTVALPPGHGGGLLVLTDAFDPGWKAWTDGLPAEILPANGWQRGIAVPPDAAEVRFAYVPEGWRAGLAVSGLSLLLLLGWVRWERRQVT